MSDDATLSDFGATDRTDEDEDEVDDGDNDDDERRSDSSESDADAAVRTDEHAQTGSARSTYAWGTYTCGRCGVETDRAWREDEAFVCPDCKTW